MNKVYRLIWSAVRQCWIVAAEKITAKCGIPARTVGALSVVTLLACGTAYALPTDGTVAAGSASISNPAAGQMQITQTSNRAVINWNNFGIAKGESVNITQPSAQAALLNRVIGNSLSEIYGSLTANGQVFLVNPNGVLFAKGASVNVGGLVASSLNITDDNFMNNNLKFFKDGTAGSVTNQGSISAGFAALLGPQIDNSGTIITYKGSTALGAANTVTLDFDTSGLIALTLSEGAYNAQVSISGIIEADGGRVLLTAKSADSILKSMVNNDGVIRARSVDTSSGQILLLGDMDNGTVSVGGTLDASAPTSGNGGFIETSAAHVKIADSARVTTLAANGQNGTWLIDPDGFTIAASGGDMTGAAVQTALAGGNFSIASTSGSGADGNINVNDTISWSANKLTLTASNDINVNTVMTASGTSSLDLEPGSGKLNMGLSGSGFSGRVDFPGRSGDGFLTIGGFGYTVLSDQVGTPGSITATDLQGMSINAAALTHHYAMGSNIDASATSSWSSGAGFQPVGNSTNNFTGSFDGLGHTISGLYINRGSTDYVGLFGVTSGATIANVALTGGSITGKGYVGGLVGADMFNTRIRNCSVSGTVIGSGNGVGGLVGYIATTGSITHSSAAGTVTGTGVFYVGGLVGANTLADISSSYATSVVSGGSGVGGLVGYNGSGGSISDSYATGTVTGSGDYVGGLVGQNVRTISNSYATGAVTGGGGSTSVGGLAGSNGSSATISNSFFNTDTTSQSSAVGDNAGTLTNVSGKTTTELMSASTFSSAGWDISSIGGSSAVWRIYDGYTYPLLRSFLTALTLTPSYDGSGTAMTNIAAVTASGTYNSSKVLGSTNSTLTLSSSSAGSYTARVSGLYSTQQGYDISSADHIITTTGSTAGDIVISNPITWSSGTLAINTSGTVTANAAVNGSGSAIFDLQSGTWSQISSSLPSFSVYDFRLSGGSFIRALSGSGTSGNPYQLADIYGVQGIGSSGMLGKSYQLANDIDASATTHWNNGAGFKPIGDGITQFTGSFDGLGHIINSLYINRGSYNSRYAGLFGYINSASISNIELQQVQIIGYDYVGALVGRADSAFSISNASVDGAVTFRSYGGGLAGFAGSGGSINNSGSRVYVYGYSPTLIGGFYAGGLVGENNANINNSYATGEVATSSNGGGLTGINRGRISNSYATGKVSSSTVSGGLIGTNLGEVVNSYATGLVPIPVTSGGLIGNNAGTVTNSYWDISTSGWTSGYGGNSGTWGATGLTTAQMQTAGTFSDAGWDISTTGGSTAVWRIYDGVTTPLLRSFLSPLIITANNDSKTSNGVAYNGGNGVSYSVSTPTLSGTLAYSGSSQGATNVGTYSITPDGFYSNQQGYDISFTSGILTIRSTTDIPETLPATGVTSGPSNLHDQLVPLFNSLNPPSKTWSPSELLQLQALENKRNGATNSLSGLNANDLIVIINGGVGR